MSFCLLLYVCLFVCLFVYLIADIEMKQKINITPTTIIIFVIMISTVNINSENIFCDFVCVFVCLFVYKLKWNWRHLGTYSPISYIIRLNGIDDMSNIVFYSFSVHDINCDQISPKYFNQKLGLIKCYKMSQVITL